MITAVMGINPAVWGVGEYFFHCHVTLPSQPGANPTFKTFHLIV